MRQPIATRLFTVMLPGMQFLEVWKRPAEEFDVTFDWSRLLAGDTIASSSWTLPDGWTQPDVSSIDATGTKAIVWVGAGEPGSRSLMTNQIVTTGGRTFLAWCVTNVLSDPTV